MSNSDVELGNNHNVNPRRGFALVAAKINSDNDKTSNIYRRFDELSARNLLFYQAEIAELEEELVFLDDEDSKAKDEISVACQMDWSSFRKHAETGELPKTRETEKMELVMKIRDKLERYRGFTQLWRRSLLTIL